MSDEISNTEGNGRSNNNELNEGVIHMSSPEENNLDHGSVGGGENRRLFISFMMLSDSEIRILNQFTQIFNFCTLNMDARWDTRTTHFIMKTNADNCCIQRTFKFLNALLTGCIIVNFDWVRQCLNSRTILHEMDFMPFETFGEPSPLTAWRVKRGIINSPMDWTNSCIIYFHANCRHHRAYPKCYHWAREIGFVLTSDMSELKNGNYRLRLVLVNSSQKSNYSRNTDFPNNVEIARYQIDFNSVTLYIDWLLECLYLYRFVYIRFKYQAKILNNFLIDYLQMDASLFELQMF